MRPDNEDVRMIGLHRQKLEALQMKADRLQADRIELLSVKRRLEAIYGVDDECNNNSDEDIGP